MSIDFGGSRPKSLLPPTPPPDFDLIPPPPAPPFMQGGRLSDCRPKWKLTAPLHDVAYSPESPLFSSEVLTKANNGTVEL